MILLFVRIYKHTFVYANTHRAISMGSGAAKQRSVNQHSNSQNQRSSNSQNAIVDSSTLTLWKEIPNINDIHNSINELYTEKV